MNQSRRIDAQIERIEPVLPHDYERCAGGLLTEIHSEPIEIGILLRDNQR
jgi:hypothetical protein